MKANRKLYIALATALIPLCGVAAYFGMSEPVIDFEYTGAVFDAESKAPIEGAYVVAVYAGTAGGPYRGHTWCEKTKGMYTAKDGTFHFAVEKLDGFNPDIAFAIKSGYYFKSTDGGSFSDSKQARAKEFYAGRNIWLQKQDERDPRTNAGAWGLELCERAVSEEAIASWVEFQRIVSAEMKRMHADSRVVEAHESYIETAISIAREAEQKKDGKRK